MRDGFIRTVLELAKNDKNVELVTGDLGFGVLKPFWETVPDQFLNVGIAEQNMTSLAAGMALEGKTVFTYSIGNFPTMRCLEQIRNDCAYHGANVNIVCVGGGFVYGALARQVTRSASTRSRKSTDISINQKQPVPSAGCFLLTFSQQEHIMKVPEKKEVTPCE